jgi:hypothetical protein
MPISDFWNLASPFVAAGTAVFLARRSDRERVSSFVDWSFKWGEDGPYDWLYIGIHNHSPHKLAVISIRFLSGGFPRKASEGTALYYEDPFDLSFPYSIEPGEIITKALDEEAARKIVADSWRITSFANRMLRRSRVKVECLTTAGTVLRASGEAALPWDERQRWARR